jgi:transcriptional regulator with XRE-family HTH domain
VKRTTEKSCIDAIVALAAADDARAHTLDDKVIALCDADTETIAAARKSLVDEGRGDLIDTAFQVLARAVGEPREHPLARRERRQYALRRSTGLTQEAFGQAYDIPREHVSQRENGAHFPDKAMIRLAEKIPGLGPGWLRYGLVSELSSDLAVKLSELPLRNLPGRRKERLSADEYRTVARFAFDRLAKAKPDAGSIDDVAAEIATLFARNLGCEQDPGVRERLAKTIVCMWAIIEVGWITNLAAGETHEEWDERKISAIVRLWGPDVDHGALVTAVSLLAAGDRQTNIALAFGYLVTFVDKFARQLDAMEVAGAPVGRSPPPAPFQSSPDNL